MLSKFSVKHAVLYVSYDGMTDPLGQSQVLPYVIGLSKLGYRFTILSVEKNALYHKNVSSISKICKDNEIVWIPLIYTKRPPVLSTLFDIWRMWNRAKSLHAVTNFAAIHCRSYLSALIGLYFQRRYKIKFIFDMRGFWADERIEGGIWSLKNPVYRMIYGFFKRKEVAFVANADAIISLTHLGKQTIEKWPAYQQRGIKPPFPVIPCSVDFDMFALRTPESKGAARVALGINPDALVVSYVGSLGTWYMLDEMLQMYCELRIKQTDSVFLFLTREPPETIHNAAKLYNIPFAEIVISFAPHANLPDLLAASDVSLCFIRPSFSKRASSPTKLGELLGMGIPTYCNQGVGDVAENIMATGGGVVLAGFGKEDLKNAAGTLPAMIQKNGVEIREKARQIFDMRLAVVAYADVYGKILGS